MGFTCTCTVHACSTCTCHVNVCLTAVSSEQHSELRGLDRQLHRLETVLKVSAVAEWRVLYNITRYIHVHVHGYTANTHSYCTIYCSVHFWPGLVCRVAG